MSALFRYARILNGFSSLISSRSAISRRIRAMARLSNAETFGFDLEIEQTRTAGGECFRDRRARPGWAVTDQTAAAARAADLRRRRACRLRARDQVVDASRRHSGSEPFAVVPLCGDLPADFFPVASLERKPHGRRGVADALEAVENVAVAIDVSLGDFPVVRSGMAWRTGVSEHDVVRQLAGVDSQWHPPDALDAQLDGGDPAVERRTVILHAGWDPNRLALDVHGHLQQMFGVYAAVRPVREGAAGGDGECRRPGDAGAGRRLAACRERRVVELIMAGEMGQQGELTGAVEL